MNAKRHRMIGDDDRALPVLSGGAAFLTPEYAAPETDESFNVLKIWSMIWRNRLVILAIVGVCIALGLVTLFISSPTYRASASIEIDDQPVKVLGTEDYKPISNPQETDRLLQTQIDILKSRALAERVANDLHLASDDDFLRSQGVKPRPDLRHEQVVEAMAKGLVVSLPRNSRVVPVGFESSDRVLAAKIANRYVEDLIAGNLQRHFDTSKYSKEFLQNQLELTKARLEESQRALLGYARSVGIVDPSSAAGDPDGTGNSAPRSLTSANLVDLNQSLASAKASRIQAEGRWRAAQGTPTMSLPEVLSNPAIQQMTQKRAELEAQYEQELQHRRPEHPVVQQLGASIRELDRQIGSLAGSIRRSILNQYNSARQQESQLSGVVGQLKGATLAEQQLGIRYDTLKREVDTNRALYDGLLQRYKEVSAEAGVNSNNISIVDRAVPPLLPIYPRPFVNLSLALLLGIILSVAAVFLLEKVKDGVRVPEEIEPRFGIPLLGHTPRLASGTNAAELLESPLSGVSEAYQAVRTSVELSTQAGDPKSMLITSSRAGEGKSTTALALARHAALGGRKVLLIDADMRRPSLHRALGFKQEPGLSSFLTQQLAVESVIHDTNTPNLSFMPAGPRPPNPAELVSGGGMRALLNYLGDHYDQIIIDSPPVLGLADAPRLASVAKATMVVIEANRANRGAIENAVRRLRAARANVIGAVLVKFDVGKADVGSSYAVDYYSYGDDESPGGLIPAAA